MWCVGGGTCDRNTEPSDMPIEPASKNCPHQDRSEKVVGTHGAGQQTHSVRNRHRHRGCSCSGVECVRTGGRAAASTGCVNPEQVGFAAGGTGTAGGRKRGGGDVIGHRPRARSGVGSRMRGREGGERWAGEGQIKCLMALSSRPLHFAFERRPKEKPCGINWVFLRSSTGF